MKLRLLSVWIISLLFNTVALIYSIDSLVRSPQIWATIHMDLYSEALIQTIQYTWIPL